MNHLSILQVSKIDKESPAEITGIKIGDCVLEVIEKSN